MPVLGNNVAGGSQNFLVATEAVGHWDPVVMVGWGNPVPNCTVRSWWAYLDGPPLGQPDATVGLAIYDASGAVPALYPLVMVSPTFFNGNGTPRRWVSVNDSQFLAAGVYGLALLSNAAGPITGAISYTLKVAGAAFRQAITPGVFPNPLGVTVNGVTNWSMYIDYAPEAGAAPYTPTAACYSQPKC